MGFDIQYAIDPRVTPKYHSNALGDESWGGKHETQLSPAELDAITDFCVREGRRQGWNNAGKNTPDNNPFNSILLAGMPNQLWAANYHLGSQAVTINRFYNQSRHQVLSVFNAQKITTLARALMAPIVGASSIQVAARHLILLAGYEEQVGPLRDEDVEAALWLTDGHLFRDACQFGPGGNE